jgi:NAD(P)-dependent dehydrogenase (short-subunit alcohol dehydrogenase family)
MRTAGKVITVTGAGNGVGRAVTVEALRRGARVAAVDISEAGLAETARLAAAGDRLSTHVIDITDKAAVAALPAQVAERHGAVDGLIHLAAIIQPFVRVKDLDDATIERVININWWGTLYLDRHSCRSSWSGPRATSSTRRAWADSSRSRARRSMARRRRP